MRALQGASSNGSSGASARPLSALHDYVAFGQISRKARQRSGSRHRSRPRTQVAERNPICIVCAYFHVIVAFRKVSMRHFRGVDAASWWAFRALRTAGGYRLTRTKRRAGSFDLYLNGTGFSLNLLNIPFCSEVGWMHLPVQTLSCDTNAR